MINDLSKIMEGKLMLSESVAEDLATLIGIDTNQALSIVKDLDFSQYLNLSNAIKSNDTETIKDIIGIEEADNPYQGKPGAPQGTQGTQSTNKPSLPNDPINKDKNTLDTKDIKTGSELNLDGKTVKVNKVTDVGNTKRINTSDGQTIVYSKDNLPPMVDPTDKSGAEKEIERLKKLAGIEENLTGVLGSSAVAGAITPPGEIKRRHKKKQKPGPKPKK